MYEVAKMTWLEFDALRKETDLAILPSGAVEVYGRHLPLGSDGIAAMALALALAERVPAAVAPLVPVGESRVLNSFPGTLWVSADSFRAYIGDIAQSLVHWGFRRLLFINSHAGNVPAINQVARDLQDQHGIICAQVDTWRFIQPFTNDLWVTDRPHGHASEAGTSMLLRVAPETVKMEKAARTAPPANEFPEFIQYRPYSSLTDTGTVGDGTAGSLEKGEVLFSRAVERMVAFVNSEAFQ
ncbi:creatininase family protein [bacterium]|nr:creatininase family protein [bacterium]